MKIPQQEKSEYDRRIEEEITKFAKRHNLSYEDVQGFAYWIERMAKMDALNIFNVPTPKQPL